MTDQWESLTPGQRVAWHRVRRGMPQEVLAGLVGRTVDWLSKIENDRAPLDRLSVIRALADALGVSVFDLIGEPTPDKPTREVPGVSAVRTALTDHRQLSPLLRTIEADHEAPRLDQLQRDLAEVMEAYQASRYGLMLRRLPELITQAQLAAREYIGDEHRSAERVAALANQAAAMILTKLGEADLAWIAAQKGLAAAERSEDPAVIGSLFRSVIHSLHTQDRHSDSKEMTRKAADYLRRELTPSAPEIVSIYGTLLLPGAVAAARAGDRSTAAEYLDEAEEMATLIGTDANHLWTAFGPTNVKIHRVTAAMSLGDVQIALDLIPRVDTRGLPVERRVRHALEVVNAYLARNMTEQAIEKLLTAERRAPEQVHDHIMSRQLVLRLRTTSAGKRSRKLAELARRMKVI
ncbi:helix-turn-helix domain-containing protein [Thermomonospora catenispora]|uniref:helix-turn-helix domain-containing protein n=1 Tax=Thermomonospora catenispora TaxID=2493090 RepID=UPI0011237BA2|nr:helix-turn-helix transcriptional regulator [Thermomonospora catenispora]TNY37765.1 XRE family transcriptional regulator [Thermomonospora catenispora]